MKDMRFVLPNLTPDLGGAASLLYELGGMTIFHDAAGFQNFQKSFFFLVDPYKLCQYILFLVGIAYIKPLAIFHLNQVSGFQSLNRLSESCPAYLHHLHKLALGG